MKNKVSISMVSLFCLMLAGGAYEAQACIGAECPEGTGQTDTNTGGSNTNTTGGSNTNTTGGSNKSIAEGGYWSQVDALTANDKLMEIQYNDTLVLSGGAKARDKALSALNNALAAQKKFDDTVDGIKAGTSSHDFALKNAKTAREKYYSGTMTDEELDSYLWQQIRYADLSKKCFLEKCTPEEKKELEDAKKQGLFDETLVRDIDKMGLERGITNPTEQYNNLKDWHEGVYGDENRRLNKDGAAEKNESDMIELARDLQKEGIYEANKALTEAMTPEVKDAIRGELGVADGAAINQALSDPKAKQALQNRLDSMQTKYSNFPKVDLDTQEGQSLLHSMVSTTNAGDLGTVSKSEASPLVVIDPKPEEIIVKTSDEKLQDDMQDLLDGMATDPIYNPVGSYMDKINNPDKYDPLGLGQDFDYGALGDNNTTGGLGNDTTVE